MSNPQKTLLERIEECITTIKAAPGAVWECDGECVIGDPEVVNGKRSSYSICEIDLLNQDEYDPETCEAPEDSERIGAAIIVGHNTAPTLLTEALAEIERLQAEVARLTKVTNQAIEVGGFEIDIDFSRRRPGIQRPDIDVWCSADDYPELYAELESREVK
jgi:hypothetical protein